VSYKKTLVLIFISCLSIKLYSQGIAIGQWREHLQYNNIKAIVEADNRIYASTSSSIFYFDKNDNTINRLSKINGLSETGVKAINYSSEYKTLVVAYSNANIDLIKPNGIINIPDIKNKSIPGKKYINSITFRGKYAYLSCGFGIVVVDILRNEIKDTYIIGENATQIEIFDIAINDTAIIAATEVGLYKADINNPLLVNYQNWGKINEISGSNDKFRKIKIFNHKLIALKDRKNTASDTLFVFNNNIWLPTDTMYIADIYNNNNFLVTSNWGLVLLKDTSLNVIGYFNSASQQSILPNCAIIDKEYNLWIGDIKNGLIRMWDNGNYSYFILPNSPNNTLIYNLNSDKSGIWLSPGGINSSNWGNTFTQASMHRFFSETWTNFDKDNILGFDTITDVLKVINDPSNSMRKYAATWSVGVVEITENAITNIYNETNSTLLPIYVGSNRYKVRVGDIAFDDFGNLWATNSNVANSLSVKYKNGQWEGFNLGSLIDNDISDLMIDRNGYKWIRVRENKIVVFNKKQNTIQKAWININKNNDLGSNKILCFAQDLDGEVWIGTDKGIKVIYNPDNVFSTTGDFESKIYAQTILVELGGYYQHLLEFENVTAIAIDGANRKWIGTQKAGVFLLSADGTQQLEHFTSDNSPLFSNNILSIAINPDNGEVFIATDAGLISYRGTAIEANESHSNVYAYPNPVQPGYDGYIAIKGLVRDANVKITDIYGNIVYNAISTGGQMVWNGKNFDGKRVATGVYLVFSTNADGEETIVTKILFVN